MRDLTELEVQAVSGAGFSWGNGALSCCGFGPFSVNVLTYDWASGLGNAVSDAYHNTMRDYWSENYPRY
jgi:hypothetical protein